MGTRVMVDRFKLGGEGRLPEVLTMIKMVSGTLGFEAAVPFGEVAGSVQVKLRDRRSPEIMEGMYPWYI